MLRTELIYTVRPAVHRFGDIAAAYAAQGLASPESLEDAWAQFKRIEEHAQLQLDLGLWEPELDLSEALMGPPERFSMLERAVWYVLEDEQLRKLAPLNQEDVLDACWGFFCAIPMSLALWGLIILLFCFGGRP